MCVHFSETPKVDSFAPAKPVLVVKDFDQAQADEEEERKRREDNRRAVRRCREIEKKTGKKCFPAYRARKPKIIASRAECRCGLDREYLVRPIKENLGAYRYCLVKAAEQGIAELGTVVIEGAIDEGGNVKATIIRSTITRQSVVDCLRQAVEEVWYYPLPHTAPSHRQLAGMTFTLPMKLSLTPNSTRPPPAPKQATIEDVERSAKAALDQDDGPKAMRRYSALLRQAPDHTRACFWRAGIFKATRIMSPWVDNSVLDAAKALMKHAAARKRKAAARKCLAEVSDSLGALAMGPHRDSQRWGLAALKSLAAERYRWLLKAKPPLPNACHLQFNLSEALYALGEWDEADRAYRALGGPVKPNRDHNDDKRAVGGCIKRAAEASKASSD